MKFIDRPFGVTVAVFLIGALAGAGLTVLSPDVRELALGLFQARMISPIQAASRLGDIALFLLVFANNVVPAVLSFAYALAIVRVDWTPPLSRHRRNLFLGGYTILAAFLVGFFSLGAPIGAVWALAGINALESLLSGAIVHGPLEFAFVLLCIAEPFRITTLTEQMATTRLSADSKLLGVAVLGLVASAAVEVFLGI
jgi:hypothetical protein